MGRARSLRVTPNDYFKSWRFEIPKPLWSALGVTQREFVDTEKTKRARQQAAASGLDADSVKRVSIKYLAYAVFKIPDFDFHVGDVFRHESGTCWVQVVALCSAGLIEAHYVRPLSDQEDLLTKTRAAYVLPPVELAAWLELGETPESRRIGMGQSKSDRLRYQIIEPSPDAEGCIPAPANAPAEAPEPAHQPSGACLLEDLFGEKEKWEPGR